MKRLLAPLGAALRSPKTSVMLAMGIHGRLSAEQKHDLAQAALQAAPGAGVATATRVGGLPLSEWAVVVSIVFIVLQAAYLVWKWRRDAQRERERRAARLPPVDTDVAPLGKC